MEQTRCLISKLLFLCILHITEHKHIVLALARGKFHLNIMRCYRTPSVRYAVSTYTLDHLLRIAELVIQANESLSVCIETVNRCVHAVERIMVAAFLIFRLMIDDRSVHLNLAGREVALEVLHIRSCIPEAPLCERVQLEFPCLVRCVCKGQLLHLCPSVQRHKEEHARLDTVLGTSDAGVAHSVTALIEIKRGLARLPAWRPYGSVVVDVEIPSAIVHRNVVITIAGNTAELCVLIE